MSNEKFITFTKRIFFFSFIIAGVYLLFFSPLKEHFTAQSIQLFVQNTGMLAPIIFSIIYIIAILLFIPASIFSIAAGTLFGTFKGTTYIVIAASIAAAIAFYIARYFKKQLEFNKAKQFIKLIEEKSHEHLGSNGLRTFIILRLLYLPYIWLSYAAGMIKNARFKDFIIATFLTNIIGSFSFVYFGDSLMKGPRALILPSVLIILTLSISRVVKLIEQKD